MPNFWADSAVPAFEAGLAQNLRTASRIDASAIKEMTSVLVLIACYDCGR